MGGLRVVGGGGYGRGREVCVHVHGLPVAIPCPLDPVDHTAEVIMGVRVSKR